MPQAMSAGILGMIMPDMNDPTFWTPMRKDPGAFASADVAVMMCAFLFRL
ncbi:hypothetical protein GCM10027079_04940 [Sediminivirga luteola]|uniref:Uncharacterized protein n=1 Tax=Sediminivirga luteola TaxID=1774748 RepID=A0A8J2TXC0_9MICO|nr:hypothetical protein GCM10011333_13920 [Sediminivirga luteola]